MTDFATCGRCHRRFFCGRGEAGLCGICLPRFPAVDWRAIPVSPERRRLLLERSVERKTAPIRDGTAARDRSTELAEEADR